MTTELFDNNAQTTLPQALSSSTGSIVFSALPANFPTGPQFRILIDSELLLVTAVSVSVSGTTWTVTRGIENTTAASHVAGATITGVLTAGALSQLKADITASTVVRGAIDGLTLSNNATNSIAIAAGQCADATAVQYLSTSSAYYKSLGGSWSAGAGTSGSPVNGLDTGSVSASTWYHVWCIGKTDGTTDFLFSTSATAPTMPSGYTLKRRIGSVKTDGSSNVIKFYQFGNEFVWDQIVQDFDVVGGGASNSLRTFTVPTGVRVIPRTAFWVYTPSQLTYLLVLSPDVTDPALSSTNSDFQAASRPGGCSIYPVRVTNTSAQLRVKWDASTTDEVRANTFGWYDFRGRDNL
jgi:hypothetical protein